METRTHFSIVRANRAQYAEVSFQSVSEGDIGNVSLPVMRGEEEEEGMLYICMPQLSDLKCPSSPRRSIIVDHTGEFYRRVHYPRTIGWGASHSNFASSSTMANPSQPRGHSGTRIFSFYSHRYLNPILETE